MVALVIVIGLWWRERDFPNFFLQLGRGLNQYTPQGNVFYNQLGNIFKLTVIFSQNTHPKLVKIFFEKYFQLKQTKPKLIMHGKKKYYYCLEYPHSFCYFIGAITKLDYHRSRH